MGLPVVVWIPGFNEWYRCATVTPTANKKDFTGFFRIQTFFNIILNIL